MYRLSDDEDYEPTQPAGPVVTRVPPPRSASKRSRATNAALYQGAALNSQVGETQFVEGLYAAADATIEGFTTRCYRDVAVQTDEISSSMASVTVQECRWLLAVEREKQALKGEKDALERELGMARQLMRLQAEKIQAEALAKQAAVESEYELDPEEQSQILIRKRRKVDN